MTLPAAAEQGKIVLSPTEQLEANIDSLMGDAATMKLIRRQDLEATAPNGTLLKIHQHPYITLQGGGRALNVDTGREDFRFSIEETTPHFLHGTTYVLYESTESAHYAMDSEKDTCSVQQGSYRSESSKLPEDEIQRLANIYDPSLWEDLSALKVQRRTRIQNVLIWMGLIEA